MPAKVSINLRTIKGYQKNLKKNFSKELKKDIADAIVSHILEGKSPVKGKRFKPYSEKYAKKKGRSRPVGMLVTGAMLESLRARQTPRGDVRVSFESKIAKFHDRTGRVIRRLLPRRGEDFTRVIRSKIVKILKLAVKKAGRR